MPTPRLLPFDRAMARTAAMPSASVHRMPPWSHHFMAPSSWNHIDLDQKSVDSSSTTLILARLRLRPTRRVRPWDRTPVAVPLCGQSRVHSRTKASMALSWPCEELIDWSPCREDSTIRCRGLVGPHGPGVGMHRPSLPERLRSSATDRSRSVALLPPYPGQPCAVIRAHDADDPSLRQGFGALRTAT